MALWRAPFADGWKAEQNARGDIGCGGGGTRTDPPTVRLLRDRQVVAAFPGRPAGWLNDLLFAYIPLDSSDLWAASFEAPPFLVAEAATGNTVSAADGHWITVRASQGVAAVWYDGKLLFSGRGYDGGAVAGAQLVHIGVDDDGAPQFWHYVNGERVRRVRLPANGNAVTLDAQGNVGSGHNGESWLSRAGASANELVTVTPWRQEGPPVPVVAPDGTLWLWTATTSPGGKSYVLGRPYGAQDCIVVEMVAAWLRVRVVNGMWSIVAVDGVGQLSTAAVPLGTARVPVPRDIIVPPPPPPPPPDPPKPPKPEPHMPVTAKQLADAIGAPFDVYIRALRVYQAQLWLRDRGDDIPSAGAMAYFDSNFFQGIAQEIVRRDRLPGGPTPEAFAGDWNALADLGVQRAIRAYRHDQQPGPEDPQVPQ